MTNDTAVSVGYVGTRGRNLILYYNSQLIPEFRKKLRDHENRLAEMLKTKNELKTEYFKEHETIMQELESFNISFVAYKEEFFEFIEKVI